MKILYYFLTSLIFFSSLYSQNYKQVKVYSNNKEDIERIVNLGIDLEHSEFTKDNGLIFFVDDEEYLRLSTLGIQYEVLIDNWLVYYESLPKLTESEKNELRENSLTQFNIDGFDFGSMGGFYTYQEIIIDLDEMYSLYPNLITQKINIGTTAEGRTIYGVKISNNPNVMENEPGVGYDALIHAREPQSMETQMYFMWYLLQNYGINPTVTYLVDNRQFYFVPCFNPDGYERNRQTNPNGGGMWRKNRRNNGGGCYGVDLNRNYTYQWGYDNSGSSPDPCSDTYRGPSAGSEPETQAVTNFIIGKNIKAHFNMHSGASAFLYPWGYINQACPDFSIYEEYCQDMVSYNGYDYGTGAQVLGYTSNGSARDWLYGEQTIKQKIFGYTYEIADFWPSQSQIIPIAQLNLGPLLYHAWIAGEYIALINTNYDHQYFNPGDLIQMNPELKNKGLSTGYNISGVLTSLSSYATVNNGTVLFDSVEARQTVQGLSPLSFSISSSAPAETEVKLLFAVFTGSTQMSVDTLKIIIGTPQYIFIDTTNIINTYWTITSTPANPKWAVTTSSFYSAPNSYTDSPPGNYTNNATVTMTMTNAVDLSSYTHPRFSFWSKWDIENNWDYGQVEVSTNNGSTWTPLAGNYTNLGTGSFQPNGQPLYDGTQSDWVYEQINLSAYATNQVKIRFELKTDGSQTRDGWYVDDIGIIVYTSVPVEITSFTANATDKGVKLEWSTASELNNRGFEIEKSKVKDQNSKINWEKAGFIVGKGTSSEIQTYSFFDDNVFNGIYQYRLKQIDYDGSFRIYGPIEVEYGVIKDYNLEQNYPNPFNPETVIKYTIPNSGRVTIRLYNVLGKEIKTLVDEQKESGSYEIIFNAEELSSGVYFYKLESGEYSKIRKMILLR